MQKYFNIEQFSAGLIGAGLIPVFNYLYGEGEVIITVMFLLALLIFMDWLAGSVASQRDGSYASEYGVSGIFRTIFILLTPAAGHAIDTIFLMPGIFFGLFAAGLAYHIAKSATANVIRAGWDKYLPVWLFERLLEWAKSEIENKAARAITRKKVRETFLNEDGEKDA